MPDLVDAAEEFFTQFAAAESADWATTLRPDLDTFSAVSKARASQPFLHPDISMSERSLLVTRCERPWEDDEDSDMDTWFDTANAIEVSPRTIYAVVGATVAKEPAALLWCSGFKGADRDRVSRYVVQSVDGDLKITTLQVRCVECHMQLRLGKTDEIGCGQCGRQGWRHAAGLKINKPKPTGTVRKIHKPPGSWDAYWNALD